MYHHIHRWALIAVSVVTTIALLVSTGVTAANAQSPSPSSTEIDQQIDQISEEFVQALRAVSEATEVTPSGKINFNPEVLRKNGATEAEVAEVQKAVNEINSRPHYKDRSWRDYGLCVLATVTGADIGFDIGAEMDWNTLGKAIKNREWNKAVSVIKTAVKAYVKKKGPKALAEKAVKELMGLTGWGFALKAVFALGYCAV